MTAGQSRRLVASARLGLRYRSEIRLYRKYRRFTMVPLPQFIDNLRLCRLIRDVDGAIVECGSWRGGMSAAMAELLARGSQQPRTSVLFDSFEGLPDAQEIDGPAALAWQADSASPIFFQNCTASEEEARTAMRRSGTSTFRIVKGWFSETVPRYAEAKPRIALLRLDGDWYESTMTCLGGLFSLVVHGGIIIIDDYGTWDGCTRAVHDYLSTSGAHEALRQSALGVHYLIKR